MLSHRLSMTSKTGSCLNDPGALRRLHNNNLPATESPRGWELYQIANRVMVSGKPFYSHPKYPVYDASVSTRPCSSSAGDRELAWINNAKVSAFTVWPTTNGERSCAHGENRKSLDSNRFGRTIVKAALPWRCARMQS